jgi:putative transposase
MARVVAPDLPHHVTQSGNRREQVFFEQEDYQTYLALVGTAARRAGTEVWAYCLMPNHVHFIMVPSQADGLRATFAEAHRRYTARINSRRGQAGHLWQGRFSSTVLDERHFLATARHMSLHPLRSGLAAAPGDWPWSSAAAHMSGRDDGLATVQPLLDRVGDFTAFLSEPEDADAILAVRRSYSTGRPVGAADWIARLEAITARSLAPRKRGRKPRAVAEACDIPAVDHGSQTSVTIGR